MVMQICSEVKGEKRQSSMKEKKKCSAKSQWFMIHDISHAREGLAIYVSWLWWNYKMHPLFNIGILLQSRLPWLAELQAGSVLPSLGSPGHGLS